MTTSCALLIHSLPDVLTDQISNYFSK